MTKDEKDLYKELKAWASENEVFLTQDNLTDAGYPYNGITIAYTSMTEGPDCRMVAVAISYCAPEDTFRKKKGKLEALKKLYDNEYVQLPLAHAFNLDKILLNVFTLG